MIRIDEIYYNVFAKGLQDQSDISLHWFDPFGSVDIKDLCNFRPLNEPRLRLIFWDQEPVYQDTGQIFFEQFNKIYHPDFGKKILITSEKNSADVNHLCNTYGMQSTDYFFHGWAALDWFRGYNHSYLIKPWQDRQFQHPLIIPNNIIGGRRSHRVKLLANLYHTDSIAMNCISFPAVCPHENISALTLAQQLGLDITGLDLPLVIDRIGNHHQHSSKIDLWEKSEISFCHVVTETAWDGRLHITEKTFKPIVMQQPFILVGSRWGLSYLREYGFQTFGDIWDESYDDLPDQERIPAISQLCSEISHWSRDKISHYQKLVRPIVEHNHRWFYGGFQDLLWNELEKMLDQWR